MGSLHVASVTKSLPRNELQNRNIAQTVRCGIRVDFLGLNITLLLSRGILASIFFLRLLSSQVSVVAMEYVRKARLAPGWNSSESKNQDFWTLSQASLN